MRYISEVGKEMCLRFDKPTDLLITDPGYLGDKEDEDDSLGCKLDNRMEELLRYRRTYTVDVTRTMTNCMELALEQIMLDSGCGKDLDKVKEEYEIHKEELAREIVDVARHGRKERFLWAPVINGMEELGLTRSIVGYTVYGDWSCEVVRGGEVIGEFCADCGKYIVADADEVRRVWPGLDAWRDAHDGTMVIVPRFVGEVLIVAANRVFNFRDDRGWLPDVGITIIGHSDEGEEMDFVTRRYGF